MAPLGPLTGPFPGGSGEADTRAHPPVEPARDHDAHRTRTVPVPWSLTRLKRGDRVRRRRGAACSYTVPSRGARFGPMIAQAGGAAEGRLAMEIHSQVITATADRVAGLDRVGDEIAELSAHVEAATARLLDLIREFDARGAGTPASAPVPPGWAGVWGTSGYAMCARPAGSAVALRRPPTRRACRGPTRTASAGARRGCGRRASGRRGARG
jgi:hypothetical protein